MHLRSYIRCWRMDRNVGEANDYIKMGENTCQFLENRAVRRCNSNNLANKTSLRSVVVFRKLVVFASELGHLIGGEVDPILLR